MLSNLETEKSKLLQIVLVGQPNLRDKLQAPELEQLRQRITVSYHLAPLDPVETANYINHRLRRAALGAPLEFPRQVTDTIHARSRGVPRIINVICDAALVFGYAAERRQVDLPLMHEVLAELETTGVLPSLSTAAALPVPQGQPEPALAISAQAAAAAVTSAAVTPAAAPAAYQLELRQAEAAIEQAARRTAEMEQREAALRQRERELAEQRRILAEEYRLLRVQRSAVSSPAPGAMPAHARATRPAPAHFTPSRPGFWAWLKRVATGGSGRAIEGN